MNDNYGLIFDVDGVISDTESVGAGIASQVFVELFNIHGVTYNDFDAGRGCGAEAYFKAAGIIHGLDMTMEQIKEAETLREKRFLEHLDSNTLPPYPGVLKLINAGLAQKNLDLAIATSSTRDKSKAVLTSACVPYNQMIYITGSDVTNKKPHPELFLTAAENLKIPPEKCLVIEDAPSGIEAACQAGCKCIAVTNSFPADKLSDADLIIASLTELSISDIIDMIRQ